MPPAFDDYCDLKNNQAGHRSTLAPDFGPCPLGWGWWMQDAPVMQWTSTSKGSKLMNERPQLNSSVTWDMWPYSTWKQFLVDQFEKYSRGKIFRAEHGISSQIWVCVGALHTGVSCVKSSNRAGSRGAMAAAKPAINAHMPKTNVVTRHKDPRQICFDHTKLI